MQGTEITKEGMLPLKVSKGVISHLSVGLYRNFARALKELISNSYDASATDVKIRLDLKNQKVILRDNGRGMDFEEISSRLLNVGLTTFFSEETNELGRKRIGTFGIGFIAVFPYCEKVQIITKKRKSNDIIELSIDANQFFEKGSFLLKDAKIPFKIFKSDLEHDKGETIIILDNLKPHIIRELRQESRGKSSIEKLDGYAKFKWTLSQYAPIQFQRKEKELSNFFSVPNRVPMRLWLDGEELYRNLPEEYTILEKDERRFGGIHLKYAIMTPKKPVEIEESRGLQIRLRDVAIGFPTDFDVIKFSGRVLGKLNYLFGEIHILSGLESALMIDRDSFSFTQEVAEIQDYFRKKLASWNENLEKWARNDKGIYELLQDVRKPEKIIRDLKEAEILHLSKERLRIAKSPIVTSKKEEVSPIPDRLKKTLGKVSDFEVVSQKGEVSQKSSPIKVIPEKKIVIIYEDHTDFIEEIKIEGKKFKVLYEEWDPSETAFSICKIVEEEKLAIFNKNHSLFKSKLSDEIIKKLSLGVVYIASKRKDEARLVRKLNRLIEDVFLV